MAYIGQTKNSLKARYMHHACPSKCKRSILSRAIQEFGRNNFSIEAVSEVMDHEANAQEMLEIERINSIEPFGYNTLLGRGHTHETKLKKFQSQSASIKPVYARKTGTDTIIRARSLKKLCDLKLFGKLAASRAVRKKHPYRSGVANGYLLSRSLEEVASI